MKVVAMIPARYDSQRFPGKLMKDLAGKTVIRRTYEAAKQSGLFHDVYVVTDSPVIAGEIEKTGGKTLISQKQHATGTDRIAEFAGRTDADIIINIQGDEPFIDAAALQKLIDVFQQDPSQKIDMASLMTAINSRKDFLDPNNVKVVTDTSGFALYFSRAPIPYSRDAVFEKAFKHIGVYAFRQAVLARIATLPPTDLEQIEKLENLRFLQNGLKIKMIETGSVNFGIDTPEDLERAFAFLKNQNL